MTEKLLEYFNGDELSSSVWLNKYASSGEETPDDMHRRMAQEFSRIEDKYVKDEESNFDEDRFLLLSAYGKNREPLTLEHIYGLLEKFRHIIPQGSIMATLGTAQIASLSNCWVIESPTDSYGGIHKADGDLIYYYKRRGGVGMDISNLRPEGTPTNNAAKTTSGAVTFMERFSNTTREVAMNGRRGALMISINVNHPDVLSFARIKSDRTKVTGANVSIKLNNEFMKAVENDGDYILKFPCENHSVGIAYMLDKEIPYNKLYEYSKGIYHKKIKAKEYWDEFIKQAKDNAEPGLMYWDNIIDYDPASIYTQYSPVTSNPCGEQFLQPNDSCRLMVHRLDTYVENPFTPEATFNMPLFYKICYEGMRLGDDLVDLEAEYIQKIIDKIKSDPESESIKRQELELWEKSLKICVEGRRVGMGITGLGDMLACMNVKYGSDESLEIIDEIMKVKMKAELDCTIDLAILRGTFEGWNGDKEYAITDLYSDKPYYGNSFYEMLVKEFTPQMLRMKKYGRRNVSWSTIAPTGSVSLLANNCTSGCEPLFSPYYFRRKKINPGQEGVRVDFVDQNGDNWQEYPVLHPKFRDWLELNYQKLGISHIISEISKDELEKAFEQSPWYQSTANDIDWLKRIEIQAILQKYTTNAISSTINLPSTVTYEEVSKIYMEGWKKGLKGQTIYVDGSRSGVLITELEKPKTDEFGYTEAIKRPRELDAELHVVTSKGTKYAIIVGMLDNKPYEVFGFVNPETNNSSNIYGKLIKKSKNHYSFISPNYSIDNVQLSDKPDEALLTRWISLLLRHGANPKFVIEQTEKSKVEITSFSKCVVRVLKKYIPDNETSTVHCPECNEQSMVFEEGCKKCVSCGYTAC